MRNSSESESSPIVIEPEAKSDIRAARDYYSDKGDQTSDRFRDELTQIFELLSRHPEAVAVAFGRTRLKPMRYFPYVIGYIYFAGVAVVGPSFSRSEEVLESKAAECYNQSDSRALDRAWCLGCRKRL